MNIAIIASAYGYQPNQIKPWVESLKKSGFGGKVFVVVYNPQDDSLLNYLKENDIFTFVVNLTGDVNMATQRFLNYCDVLESDYAKDVEAVISTDIRDLIFQKDPGIWLKDNIQDYDLIASSEGITYRHEDWNGDNLEIHFGKNMYLKLADKETVCSGIIAGRKDMIIKLYKTIYELSYFSNDPGAFVDQLFYAVAIYEIFREKTLIVPATEDWCANLGTLKAIPENSPNWSTGSRTQYNSLERIRDNKTFVEVMKCNVPEMKEDGLIYADNGKPFAMVHQYDRYQPWKEKILGTEKDVTIVTALYDIGRENWEGFQRPHDYYKNMMKRVLTIDSPMAVFVDEKDVDFVKEFRGNKKVHIVPLAFEDFITYKKWGSRIKEVMNSEEFLKDQTVPNHPQIKYPEYNILMHEKIQFVKKICEENPFNTEQFMWLDAGVFHINDRHDLINKKFPTSVIEDNNMHFICLEKPKETDKDLEKFYKGHNVRIIGTSWLGHKDTIPLFANEYEKLIEESLDKNLMDQDQSFLTICALRKPEIVNTHLGTWRDALNHWG